MKILVYISIILSILSGIYITYAYELSDTDIATLDGVEDKIFLLLDKEEGLKPQSVLLYIDQLLDGDISERSQLLLELLSDEISYVYYLGKYTNDTVTGTDCYEDEYYNEVDKRCYIDEDYNYDEVSDFSSEDYYFSEGENTDENYIAVYTISENAISLDEGKKYVFGENIWDIFIKLIPERNRKDFKLYRIIDSTKSDTGAYVMQDENDQNLWNLTVNIDAFRVDGELNREYMIAALIHEYAHVLTLGKSQMRYYPQSSNEGILDRFAQNCDTNMLGEGCLNENAYLDDFIDIFWSNSEELAQVREEKLNVYTGNEENFITEYAATNPGEDIAESFTYFILKPKPSNSTIADKKLSFFLYL